ncbi:MAG TPA: hypothetical protein VMA36_02725 [Candidatus Limnocylindria bacterium]|nr:hypothetical protein [Candidatus Limnocylindria bacterium]
MHRPIVVSLALSAITLLGIAPTPEPSPEDTRPPCARATVWLVQDVDSARARIGDAFAFRVVDDAAAPDGTPIPAGTIGEGIVASTDHAQRGGIPGYLVLETRFVALVDGRRIPVFIDPKAQSAIFVRGGTSNAPPLLGIIPFVSYGVGVYNGIHHGKDASVLRGTRIPIFIGDDALLGTCRPNT